VVLRQTAQCAQKASSTGTCSQNGAAGRLTQGQQRGDGCAVSAGGAVTDHQEGGTSVHGRLSSLLQAMKATWA
jgi:hypothetical protein